MARMIGAWPTEGEVFGADGRTVVVIVADSDVSEELGPTVIPPTLLSRSAAHDLRCP